MTNTNLSELRRIAKIDLSGYALDFAEECEDNFANYTSNLEYIDDLIRQFADDRVDIDYNKLLDFVKENPDSLEEVIEEGLYDPSEDYHFFDHVQAAQYMIIEREVQDKFYEIIRYLAISYLWRMSEKDYTEAELKDFDEYLDPYSMSTFDEIAEDVDNWVVEV